MSQVKLPQDYYFGVSASSAENPDSFEVHKFLVSTTNSHTREEPVRARPDTRNQQHVQNQPHQESAQQQHAQQNSPPKKMASSAQIPPWIQDVLASNVKTDNDRFEDLHNRIQDLAHHVSAIYTAIETINEQSEMRHNALMSRLASLDDRSAHNGRLSEQIIRDVESKDYKALIDAMHRRLEDNHKDIPNLVQAVVSKHGLSWMSLLAIAFAVQVMVVGAYMVYKKRRGGAPKKYL